MLRGPMVSITAVRWRARIPRLALVACCSILSLAGLRAMLVGRAVAERTATPAVADTVSVDGFAEGFARAYVGSASVDPTRREHQLKSYGFHDVTSVASTSTGGVRVRWSAAVASQRRAGGGRIVTVLLDDGRRSWYLAVPVAVDRAGRRYVPSPPALVGPPAVRADDASRAELEVDDRELGEVATRVVRHYLAGDRVDLAADLVRGAAVTLPLTPTRLVDAGPLTWVARPSRVAIAVRASGPGGIHLALRYELQVSRIGGRWLVRGIQVNPREQEQQR